MKSARKKPPKPRKHNGIGWAYAFEYAHLLVSVREYADGTIWVELESNRAEPPPGPCTVFKPELPEKLAWINAELEAANWPPMSPWWVTCLARFYFGNWIARNKLLAPDKIRRQCVWRVGRQGGKSTTICRVAVFEALFGDHNVPPGTTGVFAIVSAERPQAKERVVTIKAICDVLGVICKPMAESIEFGELGRAIRCFTASLTGVVGFTCIGAMCDEEALWRDENGANPAAEVLRSLRPSMITMPSAAMHHVSAPWSTLDEHYRAFERGSTASQLAFYAPSWIANDSITEEQTRGLEQDEPTWERSYKAIPLASDEHKFFNAALIDAACSVRTRSGGRVVAGADFAFMRDSSALVFASSNGKSIKLEHERVWKPGVQPLRPGVVFAEAFSEADTWRVESLCADTHYWASVIEHVEGTGIAVVPAPNSQDAIAKSFVRLRVLFGAGLIDLSNASEQLIDELKQTTAKPTATSLAITHQRKAGSHGDLCRAFAAAVHALELGGTPLDELTAGARRIQSVRHDGIRQPGYLYDTAEEQYRDDPDKPQRLA